MSNDFWDKFYTDLEKGLTNYTRPKDWRERAKKAEEKQRRPAR